MKRRNIIISFLLAACLIVGVGYAAIAEQLIAEGTLQYNDTVPEIAKAIHFDGSSSVTDSQGDALNVAVATVDVTAGKDLATITVLLDSENVETLADGQGAYVIKIALGIELDNTNGASDLTVNLSNPTLSGNVNDGNVADGTRDNAFTVKSEITGLTNNQLTATTGNKATAQLILTISMPMTTTDNVASTPFSVGIAVSEPTT